MQCDYLILYEQNLSFNNKRRVLGRARWSFLMYLASGFHIFSCPSEWRPKKVQKKNKKRAEWNTLELFSEGFSKKVRVEKNVHLKLVQNCFFPNTKKHKGLNKTQHNLFFLYHYFACIEPCVIDQCQDTFENFWKIFFHMRKKKLKNRQILPCLSIWPSSFTIYYGWYQNVGKKRKAAHER